MRIRITEISFPLPDTFRHILPVSLKSRPHWRRSRQKVAVDFLSTSTPVWTRHESDEKSVSTGKLFQLLTTRSVKNEEQAVQLEFCL